MFQIRKLKNHIILILLMLVAISISGLLLYEHELIALGGKSSLSVCDFSKSLNCAAVISSAWSSFLGISLAAWGLFFYFSIIGLLVKESKAEQASKAIIFLVFVMMSTSVLVSIGLFIVSKFIINTLCPLCLSLYVVNFLGFFIALRKVLLSGFGLSYQAFCTTFFTKDFWNFRLEGLAQEFSIVSVLRIFFLSAILTLVPAVGLKIFVSQNYAPQEADLSGWPVTGRLSGVSLKEGVNADMHKGSRSARVQIVEFVDLQCPFCRIFHREVDEIYKKYPGKVQIVFKNYPLDSSCNSSMSMPMHPEACDLAQGLRCLGEQDLFWVGLDVLSTMPVVIQDEPEADVETDMQKVLKQIDYDAEAWQECMDSGRHMKKIEADVARGNSLGVKGTPAVWVNGRRFGGISKRGLTKLVDNLMKISVNGK